MKFEKLTDNKIRVIFNQNDINNKSIKFDELLLPTQKSQKFILSILNEAKDKLDFDTDGHKLLIESYLQEDGFVIFTITKYLEKKKKYPIARKKKSEKLAIYKFETFDDYLDFQSYISNIKVKGLYKKAILYYYDNTYFLVINNLKVTNKSFSYFNSALLEFAQKIPNSSLFKLKLDEYGKML